MRVPKVFGIGFQKTGTSSLHRAFEILGYRAQKGIFINHPKGVIIPPPLSNEKVFAVALSYAREHDAFSDNPWPLLYRELDAAFPGSKFILTTRDAERWLQSLVRHFGERPSDVSQWIYGVPFPRGHEARCRDIYLAHNESARAHFAARPDALLEIDLEREPRWERLCAFLNLPIPAQPFPHENRAEDREQSLGHPWRRLKDWVRGPG